MKPFEELVAEAESADVDGWGFGWLDGRATEERPPWGYARSLTQRLAQVDSALDLDTGGGEVLAEAAVFPSRMFATEAWRPNLERARRRLGPRGVRLTGAQTSRLPFAADSFELVSARHPVRPYWGEIHRVLRPGGLYFAQHVGPGSAFELIEFFLGPLPKERRAREPEDETAAAHSSGLAVERLESARCRMEFFDIGAVVWILRKCVWWVPGFSVAAYEGKLRELDARMRAGNPFVAHSTRHVIAARKPLRSETSA
ncbi:MAG TPA: class I SAM-dependent methyltransferase [Candidatus Stackebrandtia faecavium]|nr:class I SAM-dependent methyltransferase [Candidatus Stackebrandtia faecavium]